MKPDKKNAIRFILDLSCRIMELFYNLFDLLISQSQTVD